MKRNIVIVIAGILLLIMLSLLYTYAINVTMEETTGEADLTYSINLSDPETTTITVEAGKTKYFDIFLTNTNEDTINYGLFYNNVKTNDITVAQLDNSKNAASDLIDSNTTYQISLIIKNDTQSNITYDIVPVVGYVNGGDLVVPSNHTLITDVYNYKSNSVSGTVSDWININGSGSVLGPEPATNLDESGANLPDLVDGLIPVMYSNDKWVKADSTNTNETYKWYDYNNKQWANAVAVTSTYRNADGTDKFNVGDEVPEDAVLAYYVWIPRYKYKVWNINKTIGVDSYDAYNTGIDIVFEKEKETTGTIRCNYDFTVTDGSLSEKCEGSNGDYYTHPAFWWDTNGNSTRETNEELTGIWVGKYEISTPLDSTCYENSSTDNCGNTTLAVRTKPNANPWRYNYLSNFSTVIQAMSASGNEYGIATNAESHMLKNMEWGAVAYLTNSDYGRCSDGTCTEVSINSYYVSTAAGYKTGCGPQSKTSTSSGSTCNEYNSELGQLASTTGNVYGIYDMSGGAYEYVMGNSSGASGTYTYEASYAGSNFSYSTTTAKYVDTYADGFSRNDQTAYNRARLGDATGEVVLSTGGSGGWYSNFANFADSSYSWFQRGGKYNNGANAGVFVFYFGDGGSISSGSARVALIFIPE